MTSFTKRKVHNIPKRRRRKTTGNMHKKLVKFGRVVSELYEWTDRQTNKHIHYNNLQQTLETWNNTHLFLNVSNNQSTSNGIIFIFYSPILVEHNK